MCIQNLNYIWNWTRTAANKNFCCCLYFCQFFESFVQCINNHIQPLLQLLQGHHSLYDPAVASLNTNGRHTRKEIRKAIYLQQNISCFSWNNYSQGSERFVWWKLYGTQERNQIYWKMERLPCLRTGSSNIMKMVILSEAIHKFNMILIKTRTLLFTEKI